jgi:general secretion pathway protein G
MQRAVRINGVYKTTFVTPSWERLAVAPSRQFYMFYISRSYGVRHWLKQRRRALPAVEIGAACGFTLIELMIVIAIIGTLASIAMPYYAGYTERAKIAAAISDIRMLEQKITTYINETGDYPDSLADIGLDEYLDPWGNPYQYLKIGDDAKAKGMQRKDHSMVPVNTDYDLYSLGKDGKSHPPFTAQASQDDVVRTNDGGYVGLVSDY